jgi:hypothetical protein
LSIAALKLSSAFVNFSFGRFFHSLNFSKVVAEENEERPAHSKIKTIFVFIIPPAQRTLELAGSSELESNKILVTGGGMSSVDLGRE